MHCRQKEDSGNTQVDVEDTRHVVPRRVAAVDDKEDGGEEDRAGPEVESALCASG